MNEDQLRRRILALNTAGMALMQLIACYNPAEETEDIAVWNHMCTTVIIEHDAYVIELSELTEK